MCDFLSGRREVRTHLVIPAAVRPTEFDRVLDGFGGARPDRVAVTRLDECESPVPLLTALRERHLSVSYLGTGQRVPEDLARATAPALAACMLGEQLAAAGDLA
jgi:flagellar biosynthesis protein FlhF